MNKKLKIWLEKQSVYSLGSYLFGSCAFIIMIDGFFILPIEATRYGASNFGLDTAFQILMFAMILCLMHKTTNNGKGKE